MLRQLVLLAALVLALGACDPEMGLARVWDYPPDAGDASTDTDTDSDTDSDTDPCSADQVLDDAHNVCWGRCPLGMDWDGSDCTGTPTALSGLAAKTACSGSTELPTLNQIRDLLDNCDSSGCDSCADSSPCSSIVADSVQGMEIWTGEECNMGSGPDGGPSGDGLQVVDLGATDWLCTAESSSGGGVAIICVSDAS